jgi:hypothetical protein
MDTEYKFFIFGYSTLKTTSPNKIPPESIAYSSRVFINHSIITEPGRAYKSLSEYTEQNGEIEEHALHRNIFVARGNRFNTSLDFRLSEPSVSRDIIFIKSNETIGDILEGVKNGSLIPYDIFSGDNIVGFEKEAIVKQIKILFYVMYTYMAVGYHLEKNDKKIPDWCVCFSEPILKYFIAYFEIPTESPDITIVDQFLTTPQFRKMITMQLLKVLSNYVINNGIVEISEVKSWEDMKMWRSLVKKF